MDKIHLRIGSALDNQLVIESVDVAPYHLELFCDTSGNVFITDLGSEQGTYVNNRRLDGFKLLKKGDRVHFGQRHVFQWEGFIPVESSYNREEEEEIMPPKKQVETPKNTPVNNKQLYLIYGCIVFLIILMSLYL
ncbi:MAG: FHA domain-containing protein [Crocinitomicaceae bacterium]|nr:FHA domain-containing protein [Crocinitomicaceae bacterium]MBP6032539.1 FHA domain-containing protein [Crocinitomicaceae bacterium]